MAEIALKLIEIMMLPELSELGLHAYHHANPGPAFNLSHATHIRFVNMSGLDLKASYTTDHVSYEFTYATIDYKFYPHGVKQLPPKTEVGQSQVCDFIATTNTWQVDINGTVRFLDDCFRKGQKVLKIEFNNPLVSINENRCNATVFEGWADCPLEAVVYHREGYMQAFYDVILKAKK